MIEIEQFVLKNFDKVKINSNNIELGDIFICLQGRNTHGNQYIEDAIIHGAKFIVTSKKINKNLNFHNIILVDDVLEFLKGIALKKRSLFEGRVIGITGSVGKTSVKHNLHYFLSQNFTVSSSIKSYNNYLGIIISLLNLNLNSDFAIFEIGTSDFFEIRKLTSIVMPSQIIITNIYPTHLENLINTKNIAIEKSDIFVKKFNPKVRMVAASQNNSDEEIVINQAINQKISNIITFGNKKKSNVMINYIRDLDDKYSTVSVNMFKENINFIINQNQIQRIDNFLICLIILRYNKVKLDNFIATAKNVNLIEGRGLVNKIIFDNKELNFIDESYNASPHTMKVAIDYLQRIKIKKNQKKLLILGEMKELGKETINHHADLLKYVSRVKIENVIICGELMQIALNKHKYKNIIFIENANLIFEYIKKIINKNDIIMVKGSNSSITRKLAKFFIIRKESKIV